MPIQRNPIKSSGSRTVQVKAHTRKTKSGKTITVKAHTVRRKAASGVTKKGSGKEIKDHIIDKRAYRAIKDFQKEGRTLSSKDLGAMKKYEKYMSSLSKVEKLQLARQNKD